MAIFNYFCNPIITFPVYKVADIKNRTGLINNLRGIEKMYKWSDLEIKDWQNEKFKALIKHSYENTEYYNNLFKELRLDVRDFCKTEDIYKLPILTKNTIIKNYSKFVPQNINLINYYNSTTGGSTGNPLKFRISVNSDSFIVATDIFFKNKFGYKYGETLLVLGAVSLKTKVKKNIFQRINSKLKGLIPYDVMHLNDDLLDEYLNYIKSKKIKFIYGYASAIYLLAKRAKETNKTIKLSVCFPTSEVLTDYYRETIIEAFQCSVLDGYGARDGGIVAYEIIPKNYFVGYNSFIEIKNEDKSSNEGEILCTDLLNFAQPFIRYELGDEIVIDTTKQNKYNGQIITKVFGRSSEVIRLYNGRVLTGPGFTVLFHDVNVEAYQIKQLDGKTISCLIKVNEEYSAENENKIKHALTQHAGQGCRIIIEYIKHFEPTAAGKRRYFIVKK